MMPQPDQATPTAFSTLLIHFINAVISTEGFPGGIVAHLFGRSEGDGLLPEGLQGHVELTLEDHLHVVFQDKRLDKQAVDFSFGGKVIFYLVCPLAPPSK